MISTVLPNALVPTQPYYAYLHINIWEMHFSKMTCNKANEMLQGLRILNVEALQQNHLFVEGGN